MLVVTKSDILYSFTPNDPYDRLAESAAKIARQNFQWSYTTLLLFNSTVVTGVDLFLKLYKKTQVIGKGMFYPPYAQRTKQYILFGTDILNIEQMLHWMNWHKFDNTGKYIITCQSQECDENKAVDIFWSYKITKVIFLKLTGNREVIGYTYFYPDDDCHKSKAIKTAFCTNNDMCGGIFSTKMKNLRGCPITVSTFLQVPYMNITNGIPRGADGDLLILIAERLNASLKVMTPRYDDGWGRMEANGTWAGSLRDLLDDVANFSITSPALTISRFSHFQMSIAYYTATVVWISHPAQVKPASLKLFYPFATLSQIVLAVTFLSVGALAWFVNSRYWPWYNKKNKRKSSNSVVFYVWMICMGLPSTKLPVKPAFVYMILIWIWYCFLIRTLYQVYLIGSLQGVFYYDQLDTIEEAYSRNYSFGGGLALRDYYIDYPIIYDAWQKVNTTDIVPTLMNLSTHSKNFVLAMNSETAKITIKRKKLVVRILPQTLITSPTVIFYKKFSPLVEVIDIILIRLIESGFVEQIYKNYASRTEPEVDNRTPITLEHYTGCYVILIIGWVVSTALFIIELFIAKYRK